MGALENRDQNVQKHLDNHYAALPALMLALLLLRVEKLLYAYLHLT